MSILVSKDNALKAIEVAFWNEDLKDAIRIVTDNEITQPEIVRCMDCKYKQGSCCDYSAVYVQDNGFCHWGKRRTDEDD